MSYFIKVGRYFLNLSAVTIVELSENAIQFRTVDNRSLTFEGDDRDKALRLLED